MLKRRYGGNLMHEVILILSRQVAICRKHWSSNITCQFILGILIGILVGLCVISYDDEIFTTFAQTNSISININQRIKQFTSNNFNISILSNIHIQCIIFIHPNQLFKRKYIETLRDTYTKQCNHSVYVTNSKDIRRNFCEELNIAFVNTKKTHYHWNLYRELIIYSTKYNQQRNLSWTIIADEQTFIVMRNLRRLLLAFNDSIQQSIIFGRISSKRNLRSFLFPWNIYTTILPEAGIVFSPTALEFMTNGSCFRWLSPRATDRAMIKCSSLMNVQLIDPIDKEGKHLFTANGLQELVVDKKSEFSKKHDSLYCCSDEAVSFGGLNYREQRVLDFVTTRMKVFGY